MFFRRHIEIRTLIRWGREREWDRGQSDIKGFLEDERAGKTPGRSDCANIACVSTVESKVVWWFLPCDDIIEDNLFCQVVEQNSRSHVGMGPDLVALPTSQL